MVHKIALNDDIEKEIIEKIKTASDSEKEFYDLIKKYNLNEFDVLQIQEELNN